jgi:hypothetical protein
MRWSDLPLNPSNRTLREFAGMWCLCFGTLAAWYGFVRLETDSALVLAVLAVIGTIAGLLFPRVLRPIFVTWLVLAFPIGWAVSRLLLVALFFGMVTPIAYLFRLFGRDALQLRSQSTITYWTPKSMSADPASYFRQY